MHRASVIFLVLLAACDSPSPGMHGQTHFETQIEQTRFTVWQRGSKVEIIRHGFIRPTDQPRMKALMVQAAQATTGCMLRPETIEGDTGVLRAQLQCDQVPQPAPDLRQIKAGPAPS
ncbi:hypothetical protein LY56_00587 [Roseinatronobacter thiooxidans]|uniref:Lipoprotein n=3 Tax=Roseinatronobacter thiooxidans TaxID=121821 RepID=A0A2W7QGL3_9RHOB|nr:hypothetical protein LY56_00587 [Roseinatronobacter thiooxidans]